MAIHEILSNIEKCTCTLRSAQHNGHSNILRLSMDLLEYYVADLRSSVNDEIHKIQFSKQGQNNAATITKNSKQ